MAWYSSFRDQVILVTGASSDMAKPPLWPAARQASSSSWRRADALAQVAAGKATIEALVALASGIADSIAHWARTPSQCLAAAFKP